MAKERVGLYLWGGPGTIRMINLKYFSPKIDIDSLMGCYDYDYLAKAQEIFGVTDVWATYSWGFSEQNEKVDREFLLSRVDNFKRLGLKLHAYVQGPNLVYGDFKSENWWARDERGRPVPYHRGRRVVCINNEKFVNHVVSTIKTLKKAHIDGVFMDNIQMGQLGIPFGKSSVNFCGCNCELCQKLYKTKNFSSHLNFRIESLNIFLEKISSEVHKMGFEFGVNSYDPRMNLKITTGVDLSVVAKVSDYLLFETSSMPTDKNLYKNKYIEDFKDKFNKPVFVVEYKNGIGFDSQYTQQELNILKTEDSVLNFNSVIKGSEYVTNRVWHNLILEKLTKTQVVDFQTNNSTNAPFSLLKFRIFRAIINKFYNPAITLYFESYIVRSIFSNLEKYVLKQSL